nr:hypothetical protein [uncultured Dyadobacter sp.]
MQLFQIFIPLNDNEGNRFAEKHFTNLREELSSKFGGLTIYNRSPVKGLWKEVDGATVADEMIIFEVMTENVDDRYWEDLKRRLEAAFSQEEIMMRYYDISKV